MFALNRTTRVFLKIGATDLRLGFDGLYGEVVSILTQDPPPRATCSGSATERAPR